MKNTKRLLALVLTLCMVLPMCLVATVSAEEAAPVVEETAPAVEEKAAEPAPEEKPKKKGFFARLFGL